nr:hypothetical protein [Tanacetum cinerariifolium]
NTPETSYSAVAQFGGVTPESYDGLIDKVYSWLQAEEIASEGQPIIFIDSGTGESHKREGQGRVQEGRTRKGETRTEEPDRGGRQIRKVSSLGKEIKKGKAKQTDTQLGEWAAPA